MNCRGWGGGEVNCRGWGEGARVNCRGGEEER